MSQNALTLKYRPSQLDDLVGQDKFVLTAKQSAKLKRYSHAYFFSGDRGCGKTSSARIMANLINCENVKDGVVCGKCTACLTIPFGISPDVIELDGAKNRKVEDITALIEGASWGPQQLNKKIFILDEVQQLSNTAISALLKIVEEPPEYLVFIFCTTEPDKIPDTILSRSQRHIFNRISSKDIVKRLKYVANKENITIDEEGLFSVAQMGRGSMRDSLVCLEQIVIASGENKIDKDVVTKYFGMADRRAIYKIIESMINGDYSMVLEQSNDMIVASIDIRSILSEISEAFRNILVVKIQGEKTKLVDLPDYEIERLFKLGQSMGLGQLDKVSKEFSTIEKELAYSINKRLIMESTLIRCTARLHQK